MNKLTIVLDNLRSCHNIGSIIRTAEGFGCRDLVFIGITPYPEIEADQRLQHQIRAQTTKISKTSLGAEATIRGRYFKTALEFLQTLENEQIICLEQTPRSTKLADYRPQGENCLVLGNELQGICAELLAAATTCLAIPMHGSKESFNVAVAAGIALYHCSLHQ